MIDVPEGFTLQNRENSLIALHDTICKAALEKGLDRPWALLKPRPKGPGTGRGPRAVIVLPGGVSLLVKQYLRGGFLSRFNRERYFNPRRFFEEIEVGYQAKAAGLPVGEPLGLVVRRAPPGWRAWGMFRFIENARDLAAWFAGGEEPRLLQELWNEALGLVRRAHEAGLDHPDLNLGNILARRAPDGRFDLFLIDLDRARWRGEPLLPWSRQKALERLERSRRKVLNQIIPQPPH